MKVNLKKKNDVIKCLKDITGKNTKIVLLRKKKAMNSHSFFTDITLY